MRFRGFLVSFLFALGLTGVLLLISFLIAHWVYGDFLAPGAGVEIGGVSLVLLAMAYLLGRGTELPIRLIILYIIGFGGIRIAVLPIQRRDFGEWAAVDYVLLVVGVSLFSGVLLWAYSYRRAGRLKSPAV
jgi:hypothetical protein